MLKLSILARFLEFLTMQNMRGFIVNEKKQHAFTVYFQWQNEGQNEEFSSSFLILFAEYKIYTYIVIFIILNYRAWIF
jgi:hypothetical protein